MGVLTATFVIPPRARRSKRGSPTPATGRPASPTSGRGSGVASNMISANPAPETPSTRAWWILVSTATRPPATPSMNHSSHSGLLRSSL